MARCITDERQGRSVFYGAMIAEGIIALVWAAAGVSCYDNSQALLQAGGGCSAVVYYICQTTMGKIGAVLAMIGVIVCPISSGDTAYRSARLTIADWFNIDQSDWKKRLFVTVPLLGVGAVICNLDYSMVWRYFSWSNQTLAMIVLWATSVYLLQNEKKFVLTLFPALFMTAISVTYFIVAPECLGILWDKLNFLSNVSYMVAIIIGIISAFVALIIFMKYRKNS